MQTSRILFFGATLGVLLSAIRAPLGLDLVHVHAASPAATASFRAAALLCTAALIARARGLFANGWGAPALFTGLALGALVQGFFTSGVLAPEGRLGFGLVALMLCALAMVLSRGKAQEVQETNAPQRLEMIAAACAGAGCAIALELLSSRLRLFSTGLPRADGVMTGVFFVLAALAAGGFSLGSRATATTRRAWGVALVAAAAASTLGGLVLLGNLTGSPDPLIHFTSRFGLGLHKHGTAGWDAVLAGRTLVGPAFLLAAGIVLARDRRWLAALIGGGALGALAFPPLREALAEPTAWRAALQDTSAGQLAAIGASVAGLGGLFALVRSRGAARLGGGVAVAAAIAAWAVPHPAVWVLSPWYQAPIEPHLLVDSADGLLTVESDTLGTRMLTVDRFRVTPNTTEEEADNSLIDAALALAPVGERAPRVLFVGQMTPARAKHLRMRGVVEVELSSPWSQHAAAIEAALFEGEEGLGRTVSPRDALAKIESGAYDVVIVPPLRGSLLRASGANFTQHSFGAVPSPATAALDAPAGTSAVVWIDASADLSHRSLSERVLLEGSDLFSPSIGHLSQTARERLATSTTPPTDLASGESRFGAPTIGLALSSSASHRDAGRSATFGRLASVDGAAPLARALGGLYAAQVPDTIFATPQERVELPAESLALFREAGLDPEAGPGTRGIVEALALVLVGKRVPDKLVETLGPVADVHEDWGWLQRAVARGHMELLNAKASLPYFARALRAEPFDIVLLTTAADWALRAGALDTCVNYLERAQDLQPTRRDVRRALATARVRRGDPGAVDQIRALLEEEPGDDELELYLEGGPYPAVEQGFNINPFDHEDEHGHGGDAHEDGPEEAAPEVHSPGDGHAHPVGDAHS